MFYVAACVMCRGRCTAMHWIFMCRQLIQVHKLVFHNTISVIWIVHTKSLRTASVINETVHCSVYTVQCVRRHALTDQLKYVGCILCSNSTFQISRGWRFVRDFIYTRCLHACNTNSEQHNFIASVFVWRIWRSGGRTAYDRIGRTDCIFLRVFIIS